MKQTVDSIRWGARRLGLVISFLSISVGAMAQPMAPSEVPAPLRPWVDWALEGYPHQACAGVLDSRWCVWPGRLSLEATPTGARFEQRVELDADVAVQLPGGDEQWPQDVTLDGRPAIVLVREGRPAVFMAKGTHLIVGNIPWESIPEVLKVPPSTGMVDLRLNGEPIAQPRRDRDGTLWLQRREQEAEEQDRLSVEVYRRVNDGVPIQIMTHIVLRAGGRSREVALGAILVDGAVPVAIESTLPARLDADGLLTVQVRPGTHTVQLTTRTRPERDPFAAPSPGAPWPDEEIWVFSANEALRQVELSGAPSVDPTRTAMPDAWRQLPAYVLGGDRALTLTTTRRGEPDPAPNAVTLARDLWLDLDGEGFTVRDSIGGSMRHGWRMDLLEGELGRVSVDGADQLITASEAGSGVELRQGSLSIHADWRAPDALTDLPAVGWSEDVQFVSANLNLPPGWSLFATRGVDDVNNTWISNWDVYAFFFVLIIAVSTGKLLGIRMGLLALLTLAICYGENGAPKSVWLVLLVVIALLRVMPSGWPRRLMRYGFYVVALSFALIVIPFAVSQIRSAIFPQLRDDGQGWERPGMVMSPMGAMEEPEPEWMDEEMEMGRGAQPGFAGGEERLAGAVAPSSANRYAIMDSSAPEDDSMARESARSAASTSAALMRQDPNAVIQTGPGVPNWNWQSWQLRWSGPVASDHRIHLYLISPAMKRLLTALRMLMLFGLGIALVRDGLKGREDDAKPPSDGGDEEKGRPENAVAAAALFALLLLPLGVSAQSVNPSPELLTELGQRLTAKPLCAPNCVSVSRLSLSMTETTLDAELEVHAGATMPLQLPGPLANWTPGEVTIDGRSTTAVVAGEDGFLYVRVPEGRHRVKVRGGVGGGHLTLTLGANPHHVDVDAEGWDVEGVRDDGQAEGTIQLRRLVEEASQEAFDAQNLAPWLIVERRFEIGVRWVVRTRVRRLGPVGSPVVIRIPLLEGESVTQQGVLIEDGHAVVNFDRSGRELNYESSLEPSGTLELSAPEGGPWTERWDLACGPIYRCSAEGLTPIAHVQEDSWTPYYLPWPGESLTIRFARPEAVEGQTKTIDEATLTFSPGIRRLSAQLDLRIRASQGGVHTFTLPEGSRVESLQVGYQDQPIQQEGREVQVNLPLGGDRVSMRWQQHEGLGSRFLAPEVMLGSEVVNATVKIELPDDRWLLWVNGPSWGPAILFWPYLLLVLLFGFLLSRIPRSPLKVYQWVLLGLGLAQIDIVPALIVVGWFFALRQRRERPDLSTTAFDLRQVALVGLTLVALGCLYSAVHTGLLLHPDMLVAGPQSHGASLSWYVDRSPELLPRPSVISVPLWAYRVTMLLWALWLAFSLIGWLKEGWQAFGEGGLWKKGEKKSRPPAAGGPTPGGFGTAGSAGGGFGAPPTKPYQAPPPAASDLDLRARATEPEAESEGEPEAETDRKPMPDSVKPDPDEAAFYESLDPSED